MNIHNEVIPNLFLLAGCGVSDILFLFISRTDFCKEPAIRMIKLPTEIKMVIKQSKILFCDGYGFTEFPADLLISALEYAAEVGTSIFFDPGPRGETLANGTPEEREALEKFLRMSDVLLVTSEEVIYIPFYILTKHIFYFFPPYILQDYSVTN